MVYKEALEIIHKYESIRGKKIEKGFTIKDIIIVPADKEKRKDFINDCLLNNLNKEKYFQERTEVYIWAIDTDFLKSANILFYKDLTNK